MPQFPSQLELRKLDDGDTVQFVSRTPNYGSAGFIFCVKYFRGRITKVFITPLQQPNAKEKFIIDVTDYKNVQDLTINSCKGLENPRIWHHFFCKEHKAPAFYCYVPYNSNEFSVELFSFSIAIYFDKSIPKSTLKEKTP